MDVWNSWMHEDGTLLEHIVAGSIIDLASGPGMILAVVQGSVEDRWWIYVLISEWVSIETRQRHVVTVQSRPWRQTLRGGETCTTGETGRG